MTKADLINEIAGSTGVDKTTIANILESFMDTVKDSLARDENVYLRGFGSLVVKQKAEKKARNINTNTEIIVPARKVPAFKPSKEFKLKM